MILNLVLFNSVRLSISVACAMYSTPSVTQLACLSDRLWLARKLLFRWAEVAYTHTQWTVVCETHWFQFVHSMSFGDFCLLAIFALLFTLCKYEMVRYFVWALMGQNSLDRLSIRMQLSISRFVACLFSHAAIYTSNQLIDAQLTISQSVFNGFAVSRPISLSIAHAIAFSSEVLHVSGGRR